MRCRTRCALVGVLLLVGLPLTAEESPSLPQPLSLDDALALARDDIASVELARARRDARTAELAAIESISSVRLDAVARLRWSDPLDAAVDLGHGANRPRILLSRRLVDCGYIEALETMAGLAADSSQWRYLQAHQQARLEIMRRFFDVLLADLRYARDNEAMAVAFVYADQARDRHALQRLSEIELLRFEAEYQSVLSKRMRSRARQRAMRSRLAIAMGRPNQLAVELVRPAAPDVESPPPDYEMLLSEVLRSNPVLRALRAEAEAAGVGVAAVRRCFDGVGSGGLDGQTLNSETKLVQPLGAALEIEVPVLTDGIYDALLAAARAARRETGARVACAERKLRQEVLDLWLHLETLRIELSGLKVRSDYRELYLDRSRALFELEVEADLGDAMVEISALDFDVAQAEFGWIVAQARLAALAGRLFQEEQSE